MTEEHKRKISSALLGKPRNFPNWIKGTHIQSNTGRTHFKKGYISSKKGKTFEEMYGREKSEQLREMMKLIKKGRTPWNKGLTKEIDERVKKNAEGTKTTQFKKGNISNLKNKTFGEVYGQEKAKAIIKKISESKIGVIPWNKDKVGVYSNETIEKIRLARAKQIVPMRDTKIEIKIQNFLKLLNIEFYTHYYTKEIPHAYQCDILIPQSKTIIECDGDYWHGNPEKYPEDELTEKQKLQKEKDEIRTKELQEKGYRVIRLWENSIKIMNLEDLQEKIIVDESKNYYQNKINSGGKK